MAQAEPKVMGGEKVETFLKGGSNGEGHPRVPRKVKRLEEKSSRWAVRWKLASGGRGSGSFSGGRGLKGTLATKRLGTALPGKGQWTEGARSEDC